MRRTRWLQYACMSAATILAAGCSSPAPVDSAKPSAPPTAATQPATQELVVYSGRNENLMAPVIKAFEQQNGIKVKLRSGTATELAVAILEERKSPKADIYIANDAGALEKLRQEQTLATHLSERVQAVPADLRAPDGSWTAVTARARVIMYNKKLVPQSELPKSIMDLADPKWRGAVAMANGTNESVIANVTSLRLLNGDGATEKFLQGVKANGIALLAGHGDVRKAVGNGEFKLGWVNHYYVHQQMNEKQNNEVGIIYPDQGPNDAGAVVNISGVAIIKDAQNLKNAKDFVDFLLSPAAQKIYAEANFEMPVLPGVAVAKDVRPLSDYKRAKVSLGQFGQEWDKSVTMIDRVNLVTRK